MGSLFPSDNSGIIGILVGLIALVMFGVVVALLMDGSVSFAGGKDAQITSDNQAAKIAGLEAKLKGLRERRSEREARIATSGEVAGVLGKIRELKATQDGLRQEVSDLESGIAATVKQYAKYREDFRKRLWIEAAGTTLPELTTAKGKILKKVTIRRIDLAEVSVRHEAGFATLEVADMPKAIRERYQLSLEEAEAAKQLELEREREIQRLRAEQIAARKREQEKLAKEEALRGPGKEEKEEAEAAKQEELSKLRGEVATLRANLNGVQQRLSEARIRASYGRDRSPPGSLQTWGQRATELSGIASRLEAQLSVRETRLRELDPHYRPIR